ncbi:hypothetical protein [Streptosporangium sp. CA-115845]|uniref:hypothetical protein n=1 Tax=Streptosporangium sp. CA-115845 TaxID=3240071 RepID=UPI003D8AABD6
MNVDVIVIGAGPTGLAPATELGLSTLVVERQDMLVKAAAPWSGRIRHVQRGQGEGPYNTGRYCTSER